MPHSESYLAIQGPPGSGKSTVGAEMIVDLVAARKRVGVTANSHKVIGELLAKVARIARQRGVRVAIGQRSNDEPAYTDAKHLKKNEEARDALADGSADVVGGTTWLWAREDMIESVDVLFIDEAGQMSLADALAASLSAMNLVLLGDPQQLDQPLQGVHPPGAERSALAHVLYGERVMPGHLGLFLDGSWRLHPEISAYTSEVFYEGHLHSHPGRERLDLEGAPPLSGTGIRFVPVLHSGQSNESPEEAEQLATLVRFLFDADPAYTDAEGSTHSLGGSDVLVITPYNAQVRAIRVALPDFRVGTVDKFQGQEANTGRATTRGDGRLASFECERADGSARRAAAAGPGSRASGRALIAARFEPRSSVTQGTFAWRSLLPTQEAAFRWTPAGSTQHQDDVFW